MKTIFTLGLLMMATAPAVCAQETVKTLYDGAPVDVTWDHTLQIDADKFVSDVNVGDFISISLDKATDVLEIKADGLWLPGSRFCNIEGASEYRAYITVDMLDMLRKFGVEICGASFTVTGVDVKNDGFVMPEGAIWGGFFWVENWNTLELFRTAFDNYDGQRYLEITMEAENADYFGKVMTAFDNDAATWSKADNTVKTPSMMTVDLEGINVKESLAEVNALFLQFNPEGGAPFNVTSVSLKNTPTTGIVTYKAQNESAVDVINMQGQVIRRGVSSASALENLPAGLYIVGGKKICKR